MNKEAMGGKGKDRKVERGRVCVPMVRKQKSKKVVAARKNLFFRHWRWLTTP